MVLAGGMAGIMNWLAVYPLDLFKSKIQTDVYGLYSAGLKGIVEAFRETKAAAGWQGLYRGLTPALLRSFPANAVCFLGYEMAIKLLNRSDL